jgi:hypothetical protein
MEADQLSSVAFVERRIAAGPAPLDLQVAALMPIEGGEPLDQSGSARLAVRSAHSDQHADASYALALLRPRRERPRRRTAEQRDEVAALQPSYRLSWRFAHASHLRQFSVNWACASSRLVLMPARRITSDPAG